MTGHWTRGRSVAVALGGAAGAAVRWGLLVVADSKGDFLWPVLALNLGGSFALGIVLAEEWTHPRARVLLHDAAGIGFCGGLTTFSTFALEAARLLDQGREGVALAYASTSVLGTVGAVVLGAGLLRRVRALTLPLEEEP